MAGAITTEQLIPVQPKSPEAHALTINTLNSVLTTPLGSDKGENFSSVPNNYRIPPARIFVVNQSRTKAWKRLVHAISYRSGADEAFQADKKFREQYANEDVVYRAVEKGRDLNRYETKIQPIVWKLKLPGGRELLIPPSHQDTPEMPLMVEVPDGTWDLYLGNYERMQGYPGLNPRFLPDGSPNPREKFSQSIVGNEQSILATRWRQRLNPVSAWVDNAVILGSKIVDNTPYGVVMTGEFEGERHDVNAKANGPLVFIREPRRAAAPIVDKDYLTSLDLFEG